MNEAQIVAFLDQEDAEVVSCIKKYGVYIQYVGGRACSCCQGGAPDDDGPPFAYTVGLFGVGHPELVIVGAGVNTSAGVLNELSDRVRAGGSLLPGELITFRAVAAPDRAGDRAEPWRDPLRSQPPLPAAGRSVRPGPAAQLRRHVRPLPVGRQL